MSPLEAPVPYTGEVLLLRMRDVVRHVLWSSCLWATCKSIGLKLMGNLQDKNNGQLHDPRVSGSDQGLYARFATRLPFNKQV